MILEKDKFIFIHNGSEKFTISNPTTIVEDRIIINPLPSIILIKKSDPGGILTRDLQNRNLTFYTAELRSHCPDRYSQDIAKI